MKFSPDGHNLVLLRNYEVMLWDIEAEKNVKRVDKLDYGRSDVSNVVCADGKTMLVATLAGDSIVIADAVAGKRVRTFSIGCRNCWDLFLSPDANYFSVECGPEEVANGYYDKETAGTRVFDTRSGKCVGEFEKQYLKITFSPDGKLFSVSDIAYECAAKLVDATNGKQIKVFNDSVNPIAFTPDGKRMVLYVADTALAVYDIEADKVVQTFEGTYSISNVVFSPDGKYLAIETYGKVRIVDVASGKVEKESRSYSSGGYGSVAFSPNGHFLVISYPFKDSKNVIVWNLVADKVFFELDCHNSQYACFTPDGKYVLTAPSDDYVKLWRFYKPQEVIDHFRKVVGDYEFTEEEEIKYYLK